MKRPLTFWIALAVASSALGPLLVSGQEPKEAKSLGPVETYFNAVIEWQVTENAGPLYDLMFNIESTERFAKERKSPRFLAKCEELGLSQKRVRELSHRELFCELAKRDFWADIKRLRVDSVTSIKLERISETKVKLIIHRVNGRITRIRDPAHIRGAPTGLLLEYKAKEKAWRAGTREER